MGRPTAYKPEYIKQVYKLSLLGLTDVEMAGVFGVAERAFNNWKLKYPEFVQSIKDGKEIADANVTASLYQRACGYTHKETKVFCNDGLVTEVEIDKHYPPDTAAAFIWLKNRQPTRWRDKAYAFDDLPPAESITVTIIDGRKPKPEQATG